MYTVDALLHGDLATFRDALMRLLLPALVLAIYAVGLITRFTRSAVLEVLGNDYVRAAYAKGLPTHTIVTRHVLRGGAGADHHRHRRHLRRTARRHRAHREDLQLAGHRHVRLPQRHHARPPGDHGGRPVRRARVHRRSTWSSTCSTG